ncbi:glycosyltransferase [Natrinema pallidum]|uniref:Glycosyltransferase n=1 Tax=Natrinema pallidum TaxID=69527 RepID=A0A4V1IET3_9EURY|nr:glycosyltransferase [Natrinema pallidum]QCW02594.1 glycosyltransferase [Natrinema pallidum]
MNVIEALQEEHEITILSVDEPDFGELNEYYDTSVTNVDVHLIDGISALSHRLPNNRFGKLKMSLLESYILDNELEEEYDLLFSTYNELHVPCKSIQYIHFPYSDRSVHPNADEFSSVIYSTYDWFCDKASPNINCSHKDTKYLSNSDWTGSKVKKALGTNTKTIYPPVDSSDFSPQNWEDRENGFVTVGRLSPEKNILRNIDIVANLYEQGKDIHYHIIGPTMDRFTLPWTESYREKVISKCEKYDFVHLEGEVDREKLIELITTHKYGLHGMNYEHFGIAVAELIAGGTIPFVPQGGGQQEVVGDCERVMYNSTNDAVSKISSVLENERLQETLRSELPDIEYRFGQSRFQDEIRQVTNEVIL